MLSNFLPRVLQKQMLRAWIQGLESARLRFLFRWDTISEKQEITQYNIAKLGLEIWLYSLNWGKKAAWEANSEKISDAI